LIRPGRPDRYGRNLDFPRVRSTHISFYDFGPNN